MIKAPPFTYVSTKKLKTGIREYWRFRHPDVGEVKMIGRPGDPDFMWQYNQLLTRAGVSRKISRRQVRRNAAPLAQLRLYLVYFIGVQPDGPIKIGYANNVQKRLGAIQTGNPCRLEVLATLPGGAAIERAIHLALADSRLNGEWFERTPKLLSFIEDIRMGSFTLEPGAVENQTFTAENPDNCVLSN